MDPLAAAAFAAGLAGGVHCAGMCGGIVGTLALQSRGSPVARQLAYNGARIAAYVLAGAAAGLAGSLARLGPIEGAQVAFFAAANIFIVLLGLHVAGVGRGVLVLESAGARLWRHIQPVARRMLPIDTTARALAAGFLWGWVPCGLVYSMLVLALASGDAVRGALVMAAFGLGTLPNLLVAGIAVQRVLAIRRLPWVRRAAGAAIVILGAFGLARIPELRAMLAAGLQCIA
jgi:sulfite exporter TauE/SafE